MSIEVNTQEVEIGANNILKSWGQLSLFLHRHYQVLHTYGIQEVLSPSFRHISLLVNLEEKGML